MGHGSYQSKDWNNLRSARNINQNSTVNDIYRSRHETEPGPQRGEIPGIS